MIRQLKHNKYLALIWKKLGFNDLNPRERWVLIGGLVFVAGFVFLQLVVSPFLAAKDKQIESVARKQRELLEIQELRREYLSLKSQENSIQGKIAKRDKNFTLFTFLETQAGKAGVKKQIKYMKPSVIEGDSVFKEVMVEMKLQQVSLDSLVTFLRQVESDEKVVFISRLLIQENDAGSGELDSILQIATFETRENS
ncbi:type II secretion system protein GspM [Desulforhopalus singaporensis]|uniref:General secretion pathway protein M n=1 Tax=Desulforhopalus singaporensis TaxID=91360 RepID=A0A1H0M1Z3_9BACT|nr:type II secretion system protein GspM [Desulforhopalus singaporensis]SDO74236.1 general secretion pathway protein M [Desulforhopalus singaporensis]